MSQLEQNIPLNEFEVEADDSRLPDGSAYRWQPWPSRERAAQWAKTRWRRSSVLLAVLLVMLCLAGAIPAPAPPVPPPPPVALHIQQDGISCFQALTWGPDSRQIAMLGYRQECPVESQTYQRALLNIYDADSGRLLRQIEPDRAIFQALQNTIGVPLSTQAQAAPIIYYTAILWSRQVLPLALTFSTWKLPGQITLEGVLLMDENGGHARVLLQQQNASALYDKWDVQRGILIPTSFNAPDSSLFFANLPTAPAYRWGADGALLPDSQTNPGTSLPAPVSGHIGNPVGDASFSFWQPGRAYLVTSINGSIEKPGVYLWQSAFSAWSPDGRYLLVPMYAIGRLQPPGIAPPRRQTLTDFNLDQAPLVPVRDAAMLRVLPLLPQAPSELFQLVALAWRPDGQVLAAYGFVINLGLVVNLYDSATGQQLASLPTYSSGNTPSLLWSPDGSHLLLLVGPTATVWGAASMPRQAGR